MSTSMVNIKLRRTNMSMRSSPIILRFVKVVSVTALLAGCVSAPENDRSPTSSWGSDASTGCCIWTAKGALSVAGNRSYEYKVDEEGVVLVKPDGTAMFDRNGPIFDAAPREFSKICKKEYGTELLKVITVPSTRINVMVYPKVIEAQCQSSDAYAAYREAFELEKERRNKEMKEKEERRLQLKKENYVRAIETRKSKCTSYGFEPDTDAHAKCVMELSIAAENSPPSTTSNSSALVIRQQAIQEAKLKEQKRIADMEANLRLIELGAGLMSGGATKSPTKKSRTQTYTINGQIITCHTTGSITNCF